MSINISKNNRDFLLEKIEKLKDFIRDKDETNQYIAYLSEIENELNSKRYGLVYEKHQEEIDDLLEKNEPVFVEQDKYLISSGKVNFLLEGDNLSSLKLLQKTHKGRVDIVYIDPPYNTGNKDFIYDDKFVDKTDMYSHSKWLSFMEKRLKAIYELMSEGAVIFVSIDDNEVSTLNLLMEQIFGNDNFIGILPRLTKKSGKQHSGSIARNHDYVIIYAKNYNSEIFKGVEQSDKGFDYEDEFVKERGKYKLNQTLDYDSLWYNPAMDFKITVDGTDYYPGGDLQKHIDRHNGIHKSTDWVWRWSKSKFDFGYKNGFVVIKPGKDRPRIYTKTYLNAKIDKDKNGNYFVSYMDRKNNMSSIALVDNIYSNDNAKKEIDSLKGVTFDFPKPSSLIKKLISLIDKDDAIVLDCFAGSGTTAQAVMQLNKEDGGNRTFILCTNNENDICEKVTFERVRKVIEQNNYEEGLKYFKIDYVNKENQVYYEYAPQLIKNIKPLVELENHIDFKNNSNVKIVFNDNELETLLKNDQLSIKKLYISHEIMLGQDQEKTLKMKNIEYVTIPDYYYSE